MAGMNTSQAIIGLYLHENLVIAEALEFFVRGYISCAATEGLGHVPLGCVEQALKTFAHHNSWGQSGFPWDRLDQNWKHAAMNKLVYHIRDGHSLAKQPSDQVSAPGPPQAAIRVRRSQPNIQHEVGQPGFLNNESSVPVFSDNEGNGDDEVDDAPAPSTASLLRKGRVATSTTGRTALPILQHLGFPYELRPSSNSESPSQLAALKRGDNQASATLGPSSSPPSPKNGTKSSLISQTKPDRRQTRSVTRATSSRGATPGSTVSMALSRESILLQATRHKEKGPTNAADEKFWPFDAILDSRVKGEDVEYKIKWAKGKPTWQPSLDLRDTPEEIGAFHEMYPEKVGPPGWFVRGSAKAVMGEEPVEECVKE